MGTGPNRGSYQMVGPATWELARAAYLGGESAKSVAARLGIGLHNLRRKITDAGWSKKALARARTEGGASGRDRRPPSGVGEVAPGEVVDVVLARAREALAAGRPADALALMEGLKAYVLFSADVADARQDLDWLDDPEGGLSAREAADWRVELEEAALRRYWSPLSPEALQARFARAEADLDRGDRAKAGEPDSDPLTLDPNAME